MFNGELIIDNFAGGGGASTGIELALNTNIDYAINHDPKALAMHAANHPDTIHLCENVWQVDIKKIVAGRKIALAWFSPDCKHFSKAKGGKPVQKKIRGLAWIVLKWAGLTKCSRPRVIVLENVEEFKTWGPLVDDKPCPRRKGMTFKRWVSQLKALGYAVEWRELRACDYGAPTIRKRLFVIARSDGKRIIWPAPTHASEGNLFLKPYRTAAECIDWNIPCPSIFDRKRPLAEATLRRIAKGIERFIIKNPQPFIIKVNHGGEQFRGQPTDHPLQTMTSKNGYGIVTPHIINMAHGGKLESIDAPISTIATEKGGSRALVAAFLAQHNTGVIGHKAEEPLSTLTASGTQQQVVLAHIMRQFGQSTGSSCNAPLGSSTTKPKDSVIATSIMKMRGKNLGHKADEPLHTISSGGTHHAAVSAFLVKYYGTAIGSDLKEPMPTITVKDRMALITIYGEQFVIVDIGMRMLTPRELFNAQGFPADYKINVGINGKPLVKTAQTRMCGNSVCPPLSNAVITANFENELIARKAA